MPQRKLGHFFLVGLKTRRPAQQSCAGLLVIECYIILRLLVLTHHNLFPCAIRCIYNPPFLLLKLVAIGVQLSNGRQLRLM